MPGKRGTDASCMRSGRHGPFWRHCSSRSPVGRLLHCWVTNCSGPCFWSGPPAMTHLIPHAMLHPPQVLLVHLGRLPADRRLLGAAVGPRPALLPGIPHHAPHAGKQPPLVLSDGESAFSSCAAASWPALLGQELPGFHASPPVVCRERLPQQLPQPPFLSPLCLRRPFGCA